MPFRDGTGPLGQGPVGGGIAGQGRGRGRRGGNNAGAGPGGSCVCPRCGAQKEHTLGTPCYAMHCPECGAPMVRA